MEMEIIEVDIEEEAGLPPIEILMHSSITSQNAKCAASMDTQPLSATIGTILSTKKPKNHKMVLILLGKMKAEL